MDLLKGATLLAVTIAVVVVMFRSPAWGYWIGAAIAAIGVIAGVLELPGAWRDGLWLERAAKGQCTKCGYDLRATIIRCPECGHPMDD